MRYDYKIMLKMFNPYSKTSVWKNKSCENGVMFIFGIMLIILGVVILNLLGVIWILMWNNGIGNYVKGNQFSESKLDCTKFKFEKVEILLCFLLGWLPVCIVIFIGFVIVGMYNFSVEVKKIIIESYNKSLKDE